MGCLSEQHVFENEIKQYISRLHHDAHGVEIPFFIFIGTPLFFEDNPPDPPAPMLCHFLSQYPSTSCSPPLPAGEASRRGLGLALGPLHTPHLCSGATWLWVPSVEHWVFLLSGPGAWGRGEGTRRVRTGSCEVTGLFWAQTWLWRSVWIPGCHLGQVPPGVSVS